MGGIVTGIDAVGGENVDGERKEGRKWATWEMESGNLQPAKVREEKRGCKLRWRIGNEAEENVCFVPRKLLPS